MKLSTDWALWPWMNQERIKGPPLQQLAIAVHTKHIGYALSRADSPGVIISHGTLPNENAELTASHIEGICSQFDMQVTRVVIVLMERDYQVMLMEKPHVTHVSELGDAIHWKLAEFTDTPVDQLTSDYLELPHRQKDKVNEMIYVVCAQKTLVEKIQDEVNKQVPHSMIVTTTERALTSLCNHLRELEDGTAILRVRPKSSQLLLVRGGVIYLIRSFEINAHSLFKANTSSTGLSLAPIESSQVVEQISLEIQRSIDYCATKVAPANITELLILPSSDIEDSLYKGLEENLGIKTVPLSLSKIIKANELKVHPQEINVAIGAALSAAFDGGQNEANH